MADEIDRANDHIEMELALLVRRRRATIHPVGFCYYCETRLREGLLFCPGPDCAADYEREQRIKRISGR